VFVAAVAALAVPSGAALGAGSPASPTASCVATITSYEASQLEAGAVGEEVSGLATSAAGLVGGIVSGLGKAHAGSIDACFEAEG
jgi:nitrate/nitrite transporter NarK